MTMIHVKIADMHDADLLTDAVAGRKEARDELDRRHPGQYDWSALSKPSTGPKFQVKRNG
jgi:hypothetical protein